MFKNIIKFDVKSIRKNCIKLVFTFKVIIRARFCYFYSAKICFPYYNLSID